MDRFVMVSADCHAVGQHEDFARYMEARYLDDYAEHERQIQAFVEERARGVEDGGNLFSKEAVEEYEAHDEVMAGGTAGLWDSDRRVKELEADGVVGEVLFPNGAPFGAFGRATVSLEHQAAGLRAYNRWLADLCSGWSGRRAGVALIGLQDVDAAVAEVEWAAGAGLKGVLLPFSNEAPPLYDDRYEPLWAACEAAALPVHVHAGGGTPDYGVDGTLGIMLYVSEVQWFSHRPFWFLLWSGVFERHPGLTFVLSEQRLGPIPDLLTYLDSLYTKSLFAMVRNEVRLKPSEYWDRQCFIGASFLDAKECAARAEVGVHKVMWGNDYPHVEGSWPRSR